MRKRRRYRAILDAGTSEKLAVFFRYGSTVTTLHEGLREDAPDSTVVAVAETNRQLLVTHDPRMDAYVRRHQANKKLHRCLSGLVLLPSGIVKQQARLDAVKKGTGKLLYRGVEVYWYDVAVYNLYVNLRSDAWPKVTKLCECGDETFVKHFRKLRLLD